MASARLDDLIRRVAEGYRRRDFEVLAPILREDVVVDWSRSIGPDQGVYRGIGAVRRFFTGFVEAWEELDFVAEEATEVADGLVVIGSRFTLRGRGSGVELTVRGGQVWALRDGRAAEIALYQEHEEALAAVPRYQRRRRLEDARLYFVCEALPEGQDPDPLLESALRGGVDLIQMREKATRSDDDLAALAEPFRRAADSHGALFILNDRPDLVEACNADGVHVGQEDTPVAEARRLAGPGALVGLSTHSEEQICVACEAEGDPRPDQISVGPIWETPTKQGRPATGLALIDFAARHATLPWFAIGGIRPSNIGEVVAAGAERAVVVRAIRDSDDPEGTARALREALATRVAAVG